MPDWLLQLLVIGGALATGYGAIRADLRNMRESAARLHVRMDDHIAGHARGEFCERRHHA